MATLTDKLELQTFLQLVASNRGSPPSPWMVMILIEARVCNRDFTVLSIFRDTVLLNSVDTYQTAESTLFAIPVVDLIKEKFYRLSKDFFFISFPLCHKLWWNDNVDPNKTAVWLGLHCLLSSVRLNILGKYHHKHTKHKPHEHLKPLHSESATPLDIT